MNFRSFFPQTAIVSFVAAISLGLGCSDDESETDAQIRGFCGSLFASRGYACCKESDRQSGAFPARYKYANEDDCYAQLNTQLTAVEGRRTFDPRAAASCVAYWGGRACGVSPTVKVRQEEEKAGCDRIIAGLGEEGKPCDSQGDCVPGLFCPPIKETGTSACSTPGRSNDSCNGFQSTSAEHPACEPGLVCELTGENPAGCPTPPCYQFNCVPLQGPGDPCQGLDCAAGLSCRAGICTQSGPSPAGTGCQITDQCEDGLFCDPGSGTCAPRKAAGQACRPANNPRLECKGFCSEAGVCTDFCSSG
jgi:hypothetical protein